MKIRRSDRARFAVHGSVAARANRTDGRRHLPESPARRAGTARAGRRRGVAAPRCTATDGDGWGAVRLPDGSESIGQGSSARADHQLSGLTGPGFDSQDAGATRRARRSARRISEDPACDEPEVRRSTSRGRDRSRRRDLGSARGTRPARLVPGLPSLTHKGLRRSRRVLAADAPGAGPGAAPARQADGCGPDSRRGEGHRD